MLARLDELWFENYAGWARAHPQGRVEDVDGWRIASLESPWPFYNVATASEDDVDVEVLVAAFAGNAGYRVWVRDGMTRAEAALQAAGFTTDLAVSAFVRERPGPLEAPWLGLVPKGYEIGRALEQADVEECVWGDRLSAWAGVDEARTTFPDPWAVSQAADRRFYRASHKGRLVATGQAMLHHGVAGIYGMWTADEHRGRGLATAILARILADAADAELATLQTIFPGGGLYAAAGFQPSYDYRVYQAPSWTTAYAR